MYHRDSTILLKTRNCWFCLSQYFRCVSIFLRPCHPLDLLTPFSFIIKFEETCTFMSLLGTSEDCKSFLSEFSVHWAADRCSFSSKTHHFLTIGEKNTFRKLVLWLPSICSTYSCSSTVHQQGTGAQLQVCIQIKNVFCTYACFVRWLWKKIFLSNSQEHVSTRKAVATFEFLCGRAPTERSRGSQHQGPEISRRVAALMIAGLGLRGLFHPKWFWHPVMVVYGAGLNWGAEKIGLQLPYDS